MLNVTPVSDRRWSRYLLRSGVCKETHHKKVRVVFFSFFHIMPPIWQTNKNIDKEKCVITKLHHKMRSCWTPGCIAPLDGHRHTVRRRGNKPQCVITMIHDPYLVQKNKYIWKHRITGFSSFCDGGCTESNTISLGRTSVQILYIFFNLFLFWGYFKRKNISFLC